MIQPRHLQNRVVREGDQFVLLVETTGPGGFFCEIGRTCVLGKATQSMKDEFAFATRGAGVHREDAQARRVMRRRVERLQRFHGEERPPEGEPALLPRPGLSPGRAAAGALRRDDAARRAHEHRGASDVPLQGHLHLDLRQLPDHARTAPSGCTRSRRRSWSWGELASSIIRWRSCPASPAPLAGQGGTGHALDCTSHPRLRRSRMRESARPSRSST